MKKYIVAIFILLLFLLIAFGVIWRSDYYIPERENINLIVSDKELEKGTIEGSLGYPSEEVPGMGVCAQSIDNNNLYCTHEIIENKKYTNGYRYQLELPFGEYYVFSYLLTDKNKNIGYTDEYKAYYSRFVICGMDVNCKSHDPLIVSVDSSKIVESIDPLDWYAQ